MGKQHNPGDKSNRRGPASGGERRPYGGGNSGSGPAERRPYGGGERGTSGPRSYGSGGGGSSYGGSRPAGRGGEGYSSNRPAFGTGGGGKFGGRPAEGGKFGGRPGAGGPGKFGGDRPASGGSGERRSFGGGSGSDRPASGGYGKPGFSKPGFGEKRPYGDRPARDGERPSYGPKRSFDGPPRSFDGPKRSFSGERDERPRRYEGGNDRPERRDRPESGDQSDRPDRPAYPAKPIWQGQPVRYEGRPTVPRGGAGERNRKFIKLNPDGTPVNPAMSSATRPPYQPRTERPDGEVGGEQRAEPRADRPRRETPPERPSYSPGERRSYGNRDPYERRPDSGGRDSRDGDSAERRAPAGDRSRDDRPREGGERRPYGSDRERGPATGGERDERPRRYEGGGNDRPERRDRPERAAGSFDKPQTFDKPRSYGERPVSTSSTTFRERREELRKAESGPRKGTGYGRADAARSGDAPGQAPDYKNLKHYEADKTRGNKSRRDDEDFGTEELRLNRYIANAGICSRREADALIAAGEIRVNGEVITEMGYKVQPTDTVQYGKTNLNREKLVYVLLNKPKDFITTTDDPEGRKTVMDLVKTASKERIFPVGRLDRNTTGLLLFTNDGEVAQKLSHPSHRNKKIYQVELDKPLTPEHLADITAGVELEDGKAEVDDVAVVAGNPHFVGIEIHIGRNRIVRRIFEHLGYDVVALDRVQYAGLTKKELSRGKWRFLSEQEVIRLKYFMG